jgi:hypothetical protein
MPSGKPGKFSELPWWSPTVHQANLPLEKLPQTSERLLRFALTCIDSCRISSRTQPIMTKHSTVGAAIGYKQPITITFSISM